MSKTKAETWFMQAQNDLDWGYDSLKSGYYAQTCFIAQQVAEKALKAIAYKRGADLIKSHSVVQISKDLNVNGEIQKAGQVLDLYYITSRYPDALPAGSVPSESFSYEQGEQALKYALNILKFAEKEIQ